MTKRRRLLPRVTVAVAGVALILTTAGSAGAQPDAPKAEGKAPAEEAGPTPLSDTLKGLAKAEYEAAKILYNDGDFNGARLKFEKSYEESKDPRLLWNVAACEKNLRNYARVIELVDRYLAEGATIITDEQRTKAAELRKTVQGFVTKLTIRVNQPDATIFVDGKKVGTSPLEAPVVANQGERTVRVEKSGFQPFEATRELHGGTAVAIDMKLTEVVNEGVLRVVAAHGDEIRVDGKLVGSGQWQGSLPKGPHNIEVSAKGKRTYRSEVVVEAGAEKVAHVSLEPVVKSSRPPKKDEGGGAATFLWIGGGVALAAGLTAAAFFIFKTEEEPVKGTLNPSTVRVSFF